MMDINNLDYLINCTKEINISYSYINAMLRLVRRYEKP